MRPPLFVYATVAAGAGAVVAASVELRHASLAPVALFAAAALGAELVRRSGDELSADPVEEQTFSVSRPVLLAAVLVVGPWAGALVGALGTSAVRRLRGAEWVHVGFQAALVALAAVAGGTAFEASGGHVGHLSLPRDFIPLLALGTAYFGVKTILPALVVPWVPARTDLVTVGGEAGLAVVLALFAERNAWNLLAIAPVLLLLDHAYARLVALRRELAGALETFANIVDERDPSTYRHSVRVAEYVGELAQALRMPAADVERLRWAGRLHDLGKVAVDSYVLRKPERLDDDEWAAVHRVPRLSARLLHRFRFAAQQAQAVEFHHERYDGSGYYGVGRGDLPLASHFLIVADSFDAMTTDRPFRPRLSPEEALEEIERNAGTQFHPAIARAFVAVRRGQDPAGVLSREELAEIRDSAASHHVPRIHRARDLRERPELAALGGAVLAFAGAGVGRLELVALGGALVALGLGLRALGNLRADRLSAALEESLGGERDEAFRAFAGRLERACGVRWAALVDWSDHGLGGTVELEQGEGAPPEAALVSWLVREAQADDELAIAAGSELAGSGIVVALPLRRENSALAGFLVLAAPGHLPRHVELALRRSVRSLGLALARQPAEHRTADPTLTAVL
ncbi:MAG: HD domain-containing phosphohydrolase [Gaiellaceae bacterium]